MLFAGCIQNARKPTLFSNASRDFEKILLAVVAEIAFHLAQRHASRSSGCSSSLRDLGHIPSYVLHLEQMQTALRNNALVVFRRHKQVETRRTAHGNFCIGQWSGHRRGIGE